ncbi:MAG: hypothetical protein ACI9ON_000834, partial [Limisphaerales bacterium]
MIGNRQRYVDAKVGNGQLLTTTSPSTNAGILPLGLIARNSGSLC